MWVKGTTVVWVAQPGEVPPPEIGIPGFPDQGLPGLPPGFWGGGSGGRPGQGLPWPGYPGRPGQGLPWPGRPVDPGWGVEEGSPGQGLPPQAMPKATDVGEAPEEPGEGGTWLIAVYGDTVRWVYLPAATKD